MQELIVGLIVIYAAWSVARRYAPVAVRRKARALAVRVLNAIGLKQAAARIGKNRPDSGCATGCGSCGGCGPSSGSDETQAANSSITPDALRRTARAHKVS